MHGQVPPISNVVSDNGSGVAIVVLLVIFRRCMDSGWLLCKCRVVAFRSKLLRASWYRKQ